MVASTIFQARRTDESRKKFSIVTHITSSQLQVKTGYQTIKSEGFNLKNLVAEIISEVRTQAEKKQLELELNCNIHNFLCIGDRDKLKQIVINLIDNGIKFTNSGSVKITLSEGAENYLIITVEDTGIGIGEQDL